MPLSKPKKIILAVVALLLALFVVYAFWQARQLAGLSFAIYNNQIVNANLRGETYTVAYVYPQYISPLFGRAYGRVAEVRKDLPSNVQRFVLYHEIFHLQDKDFKSKLMREIRANSAAMVYEPLGFIRTLWYTVTNPARLQYYWRSYGVD